MDIRRWISGNMTPSGYDRDAPPPAPKRFAPYPVWMALRWVTMAGAALIFIWIGFAIRAVNASMNGGNAEMLPWWVLTIGIVVGASSAGALAGDNLPDFGEMIGRKLANKACPSCGQSIFDHTPPSGYAADTETTSWWPARYCNRCGHDMTKRTAE